MIGVALRNLRHRPGGFIATFLSAFLGATLLMGFASLIDTAAGTDADSAESLVTTAGVGGGWCLVIVVFAVSSTLGLSVRQRAEQITALHRIGATPPQLRRMILGEAAAVSLIAAAAAVPLGLVIGRVLLNLLQNTGQVAESTEFVFGGAAINVGFGVTLVGSLVAAVAASRRTAPKAQRPRLRRAAAVLFLAAGASCGTLTATVMDGKGVDAMQTAGQAGIWASLGLALLAPELLRLVTAVVGPAMRGVAGELAVLAVRTRIRQLASAVMPVLLFTGVATGTVYMQAIEDKAAEGQVQPDYARDVQTLNYVVVGMMTLFVAIMLVNTLIAATASRRREFAQHRLAGATRGQLVAMVAMEGLLVTVTGVLGGSLASLVTIVPFAAARADRLWPEATPAAYAVVVATAIALTAAAMIGTTRRATRGPATAA
ncbi:FtsX-like permease family protein [Dactylosporangium sp. AC04546]|uniref:FtsX-like permease family protein n=1 Tax=Dactylosporangium sp. AC04546 TaxID=2862460 RepID=UPI001EE0071D|nr:FtsX-like permease family protein [Dactylosporangium sp. AC04546]WVK83639.1 FtsX-like permease family protein [Dactylosporangium sp. AC04546]